MSRSPNVVLVYMLSKKYDLLPCITNPASVAPVLVGGAGLVIPGVVQIPSSQIVVPPQLVAIAQYITDSPTMRGPPLAVGHLAADLDKLKAGGKGKASSRVWKFRKLKVQSLLGTQCLGLRCNNLDQRPSSPKKNRGIHYFTECCIAGNTWYPQILANLLVPDTRGHVLLVLPYRPAFVRRNVPGTDSSSTPSGNDGYTSEYPPIDIKHSTYKSLAAFLKILDKQGILTIKDMKPEPLVMSVSASHSEVLSHTPRETGEERRRGKGESAGNGDQVIVETTHIEWATVIKYVTARQLVNAHDQSYVNVGQDEVLLSTVAGRNESGDSLEFLKREELEPLLRKGQLKSISVVVKTRQGRRANTLISGFEPFLLEAEVMAEELRRICAGSTGVIMVATVSPLPGKPTRSEVLVQGKQTKAVVDFLLSKGVPKKWIETADLTVMNSMQYVATHPSQTTTGMILNPATPVALLAVLRASEVRPNFPPCLVNNFYGIFGQQSVFKISGFACLELLPISVDDGSVVPLSLPDDGPQQLFWIQESAIDNSLRTPEYEAEVANFVDWLVPEKHITYPDGQTILFEGGKPAPVSLVYHTANSGVVSVADQGAAHILSTRLPQFWKALPIPASPVSYLPVPDTAIERVRDILVSLRFDALVAGIVNGISVDHMQKDIRYLTNEDGTSGIASRHSFHHGSRIAAKWLEKQFEDASAACRFMLFLEGFAPNIICRYDAKMESPDTVLISGHYDSRGSFGLERAPGGNDDGSGTISILNIARRIKQTGITFRTNVELVVFAGEEQEELRMRGANIVLMVQADMLAYHVPDEPPQLGLAQFISTPEVTQLVANISAIYSPELTVGFTVVCCSDHQFSYMDMSIRVSPVESPSMNRDTLQLIFSNVRVQVRLVHINPLSGLTMTMVLSVADLMYHNSGDLSDRLGYDLNQVRSICKVQFATLLHAAGFDLPEGVDLEDLEELD
ncbi:hypothetical protein EDC04DRAFT_2603597 [Pisolithus marmoratus]|nr:hypothetical protein EDC04DRAFT_2603597 [Pisolithus marmoratus]